MSPCIIPDSINLLFSATFTAGPHLTAEQAALLNSILAYPVCLNRSGTVSSVAYYATTSEPEYGGYRILENVIAFGEVNLLSSDNCGWALGGPPSPYIEWDLFSAADGFPYLMSWEGGSTPISGSGDAFCVSLGGSVSSNSLITLWGGGDGSPLGVVTATATVTLSAGSCGGAASTQPFRSPNSAWKAIPFDGLPYSDYCSFDYPNFSKASFIIAGYTGVRPSITAHRAGVVHITADNVHYDYFFRCYRNATQVFEYGRYDTPDQGGDTGSISHTFSVSEGDVITLGDPDDYNVLTNFKMWWTAT
jgi:hypothetical protein